MLLLEELEHAQARGTRILADLLGGSCTCDAHHTTEPQPQGRGVRLCIENCTPDLAPTGAEVQNVGSTVRLFWLSKGPPMGRQRHVLGENN